MTRRLFVDESLSIEQTLDLDAAASHYLIKVLRLRSQQPLELFNGDGNHYSAELLTPDRSRSTVKITGIRPGKTQAPKLHLGLALLKGDRLDFALQKATELDVDHIWLIKTQRCEVRLSEKRLQNRLVHWQRIILSACEQSGRATVPTLVPPISLTDALSATSAMQRYFLQPDAPQHALCVTQKDLCLFTGPEGGFDAAELAQLGEQCEGLGLGELILRAETAPIVGLALAGAARRASAAD